MFSRLQPAVAANALALPRARITDQSRRARNRIILTVAIDAEVQGAEIVIIAVAIVFALRNTLTRCGITSLPWGTLDRRMAALTGQWIAAVHRTGIEVITV